MAVTNTKVGFCNEALLLLGSKPIASFDEGTDKATTCSLLFERTYALLLSMRTWLFTKQKVQLARLTAAPVNEWLYAFQLPPDILTGSPWVVFFSTDVSAPSSKEYAIFGDKLYADELICVIDYQSTPDVSKLPVPFSELLVNALASKFAPSITEQPDMAEFYKELAFGTPSENLQGGLFKVAAQADAKGKPSDSFSTDEITAARFS